MVCRDKEAKKKVLEAIMKWADGEAVDEMKKKKQPKPKPEAAKVVEQDEKPAEDEDEDDDKEAFLKKLFS